MENENALYGDILKGLAVYFDSAFVSDIRETARRFPRRELGYALNHNQTASKTWLMDALHGATGGRVGTVCIVGGWYGVLGAMLLHDRRFDVEKVLNVDIDPSCAPVAESLNRTHMEDGKFRCLTADMYELDYRGTDWQGQGEDGGRRSAGPDLIINTACEHLARFDEWYGRIPEGMLLALQSNDFFDYRDHVNCVPTLAAFKDQAPMAEVLFEGELKLRKYTRFMLIGRR